MSFGSESLISSVTSSTAYYGLLPTQQCNPLQIIKCLKDPTCAVFLKSMGFKDIKYDIPVYQM